MSPLSWRVGAPALLAAWLPVAVACEEDGAAGANGGGGAVSDGGGGSGGSASSAAGSDGQGGGGGAAVGGAGGAGGTTTGNDNPDGLPESSSPIYSNDYEVEDLADVVHDPGIAIGEWDGAFGYQSSGWRFQPDPISGTAIDNEDSAGWSGGALLPLDAHHLVTVSYMVRFSSALLDEIALGGAFWAHDQKSIDFKYHDPDSPFGEGRRNNVHFGNDGGQVRFSHVDGGAGTRIYFGPDWTTLADEWVWVCHVIDMRGASPDERYLATYLKREGDEGVTRIGIRYEGGEPPLQPYDGRGLWGFFSPIHGYWDDMIDRDGLSGELTDMHMAVDRLRIMPAWPDDAHGPPF